MENLISRQDDFEKQIHAMFDHIWDCEIDHPVFQDTVGDLMDAVIQCHKGLTSAEPEISLHESCTDCPLYDKDRHSCPRFNKVIPEVLREVQSEQRWIPVTERLPEEKKDVLIAFKHNMAVGFWEDILDNGEPAWYANSGDGWMTDTETVDSDGIPIAWMPLPEPWGGEQE